MAIISSNSAPLDQKFHEKVADGVAMVDRSTLLLNTTPRARKQQPLEPTMKSNSASHLGPFIVVKVSSEIDLLEGHHLKDVLTEIAENVLEQHEQIRRSDDNFTTDAMPLEYTPPLESSGMLTPPSELEDNEVISLGGGLWRQKPNQPGPPPPLKPAYPKYSFVILIDKEIQLPGQTGPLPGQPNHNPAPHGPYKPDRPRPNQPTYEVQVYSLDDAVEPDCEEDSKKKK